MDEKHPKDIDSRPKQRIDKDNPNENLRSEFIQITKDTLCQSAAEMAKSYVRLCLLIASEYYFIKNILPKYSIRGIIFKT